MLVAGRPEQGSAARAASGRGHQPEFPEYDRLGRAAAADPTADEDSLRRVRERAELQRQQYREQRKADPEV